MELTKDDIGRKFLWVDTVTRVVELREFNPATDDEVLVAPDSGGRKWVWKADLRPIPEGAPAGFAGMVNISADLLAYERLQAHVRQLLEELDKTGYSNDLSQEGWAAIAELRADVGITDPLHDPECMMLPPNVDRYGRIHPGPVDDEGKPVS